MNLTKIPYEISLWEDRLTLVDVDGNEYDNFVNLDVQVETQYYKEKKLCVIGADTMDSIFRVVEPKLVRKTDGTSTLTFSIYAKCYDEETNEFVQNPYLKYLTNERKVKLKYYPNGELRWLDFIIKKIDESSENYKFTYTATDLFINELSKTGYNLVFDQELENNQGTIQKLAGDILASTDWMIGKDSEIIQQLKDEPLYAIELTDSLTAYDIFTHKEENIPLGKTIYAFYSSVTDGDPEYFQFIYNKNGEYEVDENGIAHNVGNYYCNKSSVYGAQSLYNNFRGEKYVRTQKSEYDKTLEQYVKVYEKEDEKYYGYTKSEYIQPSLVTNYITNGNHILSDSGWQQEADGSLKVDTRPAISVSSDSRAFGLECCFDIKNNRFLRNSGFRDNAEIIKEISTNLTYGFQIQGELPKDHYMRVEVSKYRGKEDSSIEILETILSGYAQESYKHNNKNVYFNINLKPTRAVSYKELTDITATEKFGIFLRLVNKNYVSAGGNCFIEKIEFFPILKGRAVDDGQTINGIILPSGQVFEPTNQIISTNIAESYVNTVYHYYKADVEEITKPEEIRYEYIGAESAESLEFKPVYDFNFEKVRSISKKETNRFDLLQTLSETFECWCRFDVWHKETGEILRGKDLELLLNTDGAFSDEKIVFLGGTAYSKQEIALIHGETEPYQQLKFVTFHKQIGQKKNIGFRYGMNLKSLSRSLDSNDIATKLIVKSNTNEFANGGSCNIALAKENPSGENFLYDFSHYINQGLLNADNLNNDLYYIHSEETESRKWIGLYPKLKSLNNQRDLLITEQSELVGSYSKYKSTYENSKVQYNASLEQLEDLEDEYYDNVESPYNGEIPDDWKDTDKIIGIVFNIERLRSELKQLQKDYEVAETQLGSIEQRLKELELALKDIGTQTAELTYQFENKYSRFIQEASWTSEDYIDNNLYYLDAKQTLHKSAQPKVSYTINVIELSQLEEYKNYVFDLGDITYVQDTDFFGWIEKDKIKTPYKEEIVITELSISFDEPEKSTIKAQNYRTAFEDLFQRLTATTQQLQFHSGEYQRAANSMDSMGNILPGCLQDAFANNAYTLANVSNQSVKWDEYGITTTDTMRPAEITRITSGGMFLTDDGGEHWTTGITAKGINAKVITTGTLNTGLVNIYNGAAKSFTWDSNGLNAYQQTDSGGYSLSSFVRFNQYGIFGVTGVYNEEDINSIDKIKQKANFYLVWDGFQAGDKFKITKDLVKFGDNFIVDKQGNVRASGEITASAICVKKEIEGKETTLFEAETKNNVVRIGGFYVDRDRLTTADRTGEIRKDKRIQLNNEAIGDPNLVAIGVQNGFYDYNNEQVQYWPFKVNGLGRMWATEATISGTITATRLIISGDAKDDFGKQMQEDWSYIENLVAKKIETSSLLVKDSKGNVLLDANVKNKKVTIGGFEVGTNYIRNISGDKQVFISSGAIGKPGNVVFGVQSGNAWPFWVEGTGILHATGAEISGTITNGSTFKVTSEGYLTATNGKIGGWTLKESSLTSGTEGSSGFIGLWTKYPTTDKYRLKIGSNFSVDKDGGLTATAGKVGAWEITGVSGEILQISRSGANIEDIGGEIYRDQLGYWKKTGAYSYASKTASWEAVVMSAWHWQSEHSSESDVNVKNSISSLDLTYDELFDNLKPCRYKYNHGTSDRYHTGFIAQEIEEAIESVGLTTQDFAGVVHLKEPNENGCEWLLRRDEFVALNTWQIQKLKSRVAELEQKISALESKGEL